MNPDPSLIMPLDQDVAEYLSSFNTLLTPMPFSRGSGRGGPYLLPMAATTRTSLKFRTSSSSSSNSLGAQAASESMVMDEADAGDAPMYSLKPAAAAAPGPAPPGVPLPGSSTRQRNRSGFLTTPLAAVIQTRADGRGRVTFTAPPNLGTFVVRAFVAQGSTLGSRAQGSSGRYASAEAHLVVRRTVSLTPSVPRAVRVGDSFEAGVLVRRGGGLAAWA